MKAVIYARYSSDNQREESIEGQIRECTEYAKYNDIEVVGHYIDRAYSAKTDKRPDFQRMIKDSAKKNFQLVIVWKLDRFARNRYDSAIYKAALKKNGVRVISVTEHITDDATGGLMESIFEGFAEYYSAELAEKTKRGMKENALKGKWNGGQIPFGYMVKDSYLAIDETLAPIVRKLFEMCADGITVNCNMYFADPYCAWQKGTNENLNGLLREFYPKGRNLSRVSPETLKKNLALINARPRKVLHYHTPQDLFELNLFNCCT